jgi:hypothetical protein
MASHARDDVNLDMDAISRSRGSIVDPLHGRQIFLGKRLGI